MLVEKIWVRKTSGIIRPLVTKREQEVLQKLSEGLTVKEMALSLYVSTHTVISHKKKLLEKLDARNSIDLIVKAIRLNLIHI